MAEIKVLDPLVSNQIAAGEVVERPASVVKELVENSIDAGAKSITVEIKQGGISYIRVTDDGSGIESPFVETAFLPHATSKIHTSEDLDGILTLGFRGEALASIASVSKTELYTKTREASEGKTILVEGGKVVSSGNAGCPNGTTITVKELFYNTPARMKFLKKDSTEAGHISDMLTKIALGHPEVSIRFLNNGKEVFYTSGDNDISHTVYAVYGRDYAAAMIPVHYQTDTVYIEGVIGKPMLSRSNRNFQSFFVNGRCVQNRTMLYALQESYKNQMTVGRFPVAVLHLTVNPKSVDVNVHPSKIEIKFQNEKEIYDAVYWGAKNALYRIDQAPIIESEKKPAQKSFDIIVPKKEFVQERIRPETLQPMKKASIFQQTVPEPVKKETKPSSIHNLGFRKTYSPEQPKNEVPESTPTKPEIQPEPTAVVPAPTISEKQEFDFRIIGQLFQTYLVVEQGDAMFLVDQHAAHERLNYEALLLKAKESRAESQLLLAPEVVQLTHTEYDIYSEHRDFFAKIGFESEPFGERSVSICAVPLGMGSETVKELFLEILERLGRGTKNITTEVMEQVIFSVACKSAIKAHKKLSPKEQETLINDVLNLDGINSCPHGRPIMMKMTKYQIEKQFKRV